MGPVIAALSKVSHDEIKVHFESDENIKLRESARRQCEDLTAQIETMEKKLFEKLDLLHELNNGESVRKWIKEKEVEIARCKLDLETTRRILDSLSLPARSVEATQLFQRMATKLASDPYSQPIHKLFRPFIQQITLHRVPDRSKKTQRYADVELDYAKLVQWLALDRGENRWKTSMSAAGIDLSVSPA